MSIPLPPTLGLVLAGGLARRMGGGDKARIEIGGMAILDRVLARCRRNHRNHPQRQWRPQTLRRYGLPVVPDNVPDFAGPLAGILAGLDWRPRRTTGSNGSSSVPGDCPFCRRPGGATALGPRSGAACRSPARAPGEWRHPVVGAVAAGVARRPAQARWSRRACTRSKCGPRGTASPSPNGRISRWTRSSTSTRRRTSRAPSTLRRNITDSCALNGFARAPNLLKCANLLWFYSRG